MPKKELFRFVIILVVISLLLYFSGIGCPILYITGISCPGCGLTRACLQLLQLNIKEAFRYHPLFLTLPVLGALLIFYKKIPKALLYSTLGILVLLFFVVYILRLQNPADTIVRIDIKSGLVYRLFLQLQHIGHFLFSL